MLLEYYNLLEQPFGVTPDTRFLYLSHMSVSYTHLDVYKRQHRT